MLKNWSFGDTFSFAFFIKGIFINVDGIIYPVCFFFSPVPFLLLLGSCNVGRKGKVGPLGRCRPVAKVGKLEGLCAVTPL